MSINDCLTGDGNAGIFGRLQRLHLNDGRRDRVEIVAFHLGGVVPASLGRLGLDDVLDRPGENIVELCPAFASPRPRKRRPGKAWPGRGLACSGAVSEGCSEKMSPSRLAWLLSISQSDRLANVGRVFRIWP